MAEPLPFETIASWVRTGDVSNLVRSFSLAADWDSRETIMVSLRELYRQRQNDDDIRNQLRVSVPDLLALCKTETSGGSYRENCITAAESLLQALSE